MDKIVLQRLGAVEASLYMTNRKPIARIEADAYLDGDVSVLTRYGIEPSPPHISAIVVSIHPDRRDAVDDIADMDDEAFERMERQRELEDRRREAAERERRQLEAIQNAQGDGPPLPPVPGNAYFPVNEWD